MSEATNGGDGRGAAAALNQQTPTRPQLQQLRLQPQGTGRGGGRSPGALGPTKLRQEHRAAFKTARSVDQPLSSESIRKADQFLRSKSLNEAPPTPAEDTPQSVASSVGSVWQSFKAKWASTVVSYTSGSIGVPTPPGGADSTATAAPTPFAPPTDGSWSFWLSLHQLIMMSNLQSLIFGTKGQGQRPSIQPNDYMDSIIDQMKENFKERGLQEMDLPDQNVGVVVLYDGHLSGLTNLSRRGDALLEAATDHLVLKFAVQAKDVRCAYWWRRKRIKGEICAVVKKIILNLQIKQNVPVKTPPELLDFRVEEVDGVQVLLHGLGPLNWLVKKALRSFLRRHLKGYLEKEGKDMIEQELKNIPILYEEQPSYLGLLG